MNFHAYFMAFSAALGGFLFGYEIGIIATILAMDTFNKYFDIQVEEKGVVTLPGSLKQANVNGDIVLTFLIGCMCGAILVGYLADRIGRKRSILIGSFLFVVGSVIQTVAEVLPTLYAGRVIGGIGIGILSNVVPLYISETAPSNIRGTLISVQQLMITIGIFVASIVNLFIYYFAEETNFKWRLALALQAVPGVGLLLAMCFMPVSPRWLANNDRNGEALTVLAKMRRSDPNSLDVQEEFTSIKDSIQEERLVGKASLKELLAPGIRNRIALVVVLQFFQQFSGINVIMYFAPTLFKNMGFDKDTASTVAGTINAAVNVLATFPGMYLVDRWGRRKLLIAGGIMMGLSHTFVTVFTKLAEDNGNTTFSYLGALCIYLFVSGFAFSWGPIVWVYQSEIFPLRTRGRATAIGTFANWVANGLVGKVAPLLLDAKMLGNFTYIIFGALGFLMAAFTYFCVPETKGYSLETVNHLFDKRARSLGEKGSMGSMGEKDSGAALNAKV